VNFVFAGQVFYQQLIIGLSLDSKGSYITAFFPGFEAGGIFEEKWSPVWGDPYKCL
jgi:hypothetical protein